VIPRDDPRGAPVCGDRSSPDSDPTMTGQHSQLVYLFVYLALFVSTANAVIIEEQWVAVKDWFSRIKNFITDGPATTTTTTTTPAPRFKPRGTLGPLQRQPSRLHMNAQFRGAGCEIYYRVFATQSLLADGERVYEPLTYESGHCSHDCYQDKYTGKWVCCKPMKREPVELYYFRNASSELRHRSVDNAAIISCDYSSGVLTQD
ncbi:hypothetical protein PENTCL1PPCAC_9232, partial [Pristionchus entomophagus]